MDNNRQTNSQINNLVNNIESLNVSTISESDANANLIFTMDNNTISRLTNNIESEIFVNLNTTPENAENILFPDIRKLLYLSIEMRRQLLSKWKYYNEFLLTIDQHTNNYQIYHRVTWEQSFTMTLLFNIYH